MKTTITNLKRAWAIIAMLLCVQAIAAQTLYNQHDVDKLKTFLLQTNGATALWQTLSMADNPTDWDADADWSKAPGVTWTTAATGKQIQTVDWSYKSLSTGAINLPGCTALETFNCAGNISIYRLDLSGCTALTTVNCEKNLMYELVLTDCMKLAFLDCHTNSLSELVVPQGRLQTFYCYLNAISTLVVNNCSWLEDFDCSNNALKKLNLPQGLKKLNCASNQLTELDVTRNPSLTELNCGYNALYRLNVAQNKSLTSLNCRDNELETLDLTVNTKLGILNCNNNYLTTLNLSKNTIISEVRCEGNYLSMAGLKAISDLIWYQYLGTQAHPTLSFETGYTLLADDEYAGEGTTFAVTKDGGAATPGTDYSLDKGSITFLASGAYMVTVSNPGISSSPSVPAKVVFDCHIGLPTLYNQNDVDKLKAFLLYTDGTKANWQKLYMSYNPTTLDANSTKWSNGFEWTTDISNKRLVSLYWQSANANPYELAGPLDLSGCTGLEYLTCGNNNITAVDVTGCTALWFLRCNHLGISSLDVSTNTALEQLICNENNISELDVTKNVKLTDLYCGNNNLSTLDISKNMMLEDFSCGSNNLSVLDVSKHTKLKSFNCERNNLSVLDVSNHPKLIYLYCHVNNLSTLDIGKSTVLTTLSCFDNKLSTLDISKNPLVDALEIYGNRLTMADLKAASDQMTYIQQLGTQTHPLIESGTGQAWLVDNAFAGAGTVFAVTKDGGAATPGTDYTTDYGNITFLTTGTYTVSVSNPAILSSDRHPARVVFTFNVGAETTYGVSIATFTGGSVSADKPFAKKDETVTLTITEDNGYELESITAFRTGDQATAVTLDGTGLTRTFTMPGYAVTVTATFRAIGLPIQAPVITDQPQNMTANVGDDIELSVTATVTDGGILSYQWYSNTTDSNTGGTIISEANTKTYKPATTATGVTYYYVIVTNTRTDLDGSPTETTVSDVATVTVGDTPVATYTITIDAPTNGKVTASQTTVPAGETVTLTIAPASGYELESIAAHQTGTPATTVALAGTGLTRTFTMPAYGVTVTATFKQTVVIIPEPNALEELGAAIQGGGYTLPQTTANTESAVHSWLVNTLNALLGQAYGAAFRAAPLIDANVTITGFSAAAAGIREFPAGTNGSFTFTVTLTQGGNSVTTAPKDGVIVALPYVDTTPVGSLPTPSQGGTMKVSTTANGLLISGLTPGATLYIYNMRGQLVYKSKASTAEQQVHLPAKGIYIVASGKERVKALY